MLIYYSPPQLKDISYIILNFINSFIGVAGYTYAKISRIVTRRRLPYIYIHFTDFLYWVIFVRLTNITLRYRDYWRFDGAAWVFMQKELFVEFLIITHWFTTISGAGGVHPPLYHKFGRHVTHT